MTSEVLILNKRAVVVAADSAITSSGGEHPRYSKAATKVFDLTASGAVAAAFFGNAAIDLVPWEVAIKRFRKHLGSSTYPRVAEYMTALTKFLSGNDDLFPQELRTSWIEHQFDTALLEVIKYANSLDSGTFDVSLPLADRQARWSVVHAQAANLLDAQPVAGSLSVAARDALLTNPLWAVRAQQQIAQAANLEAVDPAQAAVLAHKVRYARPDLLLPKAGLVVTGYGEEDIFPSYKQIAVYGHVGDELYYGDESEFSISHKHPAMIQPLAQTSMIDTFTEGFGRSLASIIDETSRDAFNGMITGLRAAGVGISEQQGSEAINQAHARFMTNWKEENWKQNYTPLMQVLATLEVQEMAHLAESLLGLESLKERVTSPKEEVGGPIDVAAISKAEGLVWIKRKHYFPPEINARYVARLTQSLQHV